MMILNSKRFSIFVKYVENLGFDVYNNVNSIRNSERQLKSCINVNFVGKTAENKSS